MKVTINGDWTATVAGEPLAVVPRFDFRDFRVHIGTYADAEERSQFQLDTFGSTEWLWDTPDELRFDRESRQLVGAEFRLPDGAADGEDSGRVPVTPAVRPGGLRADEVRDFRMDTTTELCRAPGDAVLTFLCDLDVLDEPLEARIGIATGTALLIQDGTVVG
ncbi:hypothetical protein EDD93_2846 [Streptomyces sp. 840.1]|uniref:hypothetical protein n=1 Tax=Streptomyces sp. 840.1 TaxID=2485152 RepID=UPI000FB64DD6|nr:hypothetical protein [Streptomyces sp. 840.1]ROQ68382.1 hypothetical protein EDD93_2846 [Streptomyces sp. 840.1]